MLESKERLARDVVTLLEAVRREGEASYAAVVVPTGILFESPEPTGREEWARRRLVEGAAAAIFAIPSALHSEEPMQDPFAGWDRDEFLLAVVNGRVALVVACPDAEGLKGKVMKPLSALTDRLFRYDETFRIGPGGRGFFFGRAKVDLVVVGREA